MLLTGSIWMIICIAYWLVTGKIFPPFERVMDYLSDINETKV